MSSYATPVDLSRHGLSPAALGDVSLWDQQAALDAASSLADGYLAATFTLPIVTPSIDLVIAVCQIAAWNLLRRRGFNPEAGSDAAIRQGYDDSIRWLERVAKGDVVPTLTDSTPGGASAVGGAFVVQPQQSSGPGGPLVIGTPMPRGW